MRLLYFLGLSLMLIGCSTGLKRTKETDKARRVLVDPTRLDERQHVELQNALVQSGEFFVVDRAKGYAAVKLEQERLHKEDSGRFEDKQKYAMWGKMYGVGAIVIAHSQCGRNDYNIIQGILHMVSLGIFHKSYICMQYLDLVDTNTSEIITSIKSEYKTDQPEYEVSWVAAVDSLISSYPSYFESKPKHRELETYEQMSAENAQRTRETQEK